MVHVTAAPASIVVVPSVRLLLLLLLMMLMVVRVVVRVESNTTRLKIMIVNETT